MADSAQSLCGVFTLGQEQGNEGLAVKRVALGQHGICAGMHGLSGEMVSVAVFAPDADEKRTGDDTAAVVTDRGNFLFRCTLGAVVRQDKRRAGRPRHFC